jgi:hypothetical protein
VSPLGQILATANRQAPSPPQATIAPTNVAGIYANNDAQKMDAYKAQLAQQNAMFGGLASLGSAGIGAAGKAGLFSSAAAPAAAAGATGGTSALSSLLPFMIA